MGNFKARPLFQRAMGKEMKILMVGLDYAGKTTILYKMKLGEIVTSTPTIGFNVETIEHKNISCNVWDVGSQDKFRPFWTQYFQNVKGLVFVVDSNDRERFGEARGEMDKLLEEDELSDAVLLVLANKQDLQNAMRPFELTEELGLCNIRNRKWLIQETNALKGDGLFEGLDWLTKEMAS